MPIDSSIKRRKRRRSACFSKLFSENRPPNRPDRGRYPQYIQHINKKAGTELNFLVLSYRLFLCLIFLAKELQELVSKDIQTDRGHHKLQKMEAFWQFFRIAFKNDPGGAWFQAACTGSNHIRLSRFISCSLSCRWALRSASTKAT